MKGGLAGHGHSLWKPLKLRLRAVALPFRDGFLSILTGDLGAASTVAVQWFRRGLHDLDCLWPPMQMPPRVARRVRCPTP